MWRVSTANGELYLRDQLLADRARAEARDVLGLGVGQRQARADAVRRVLHRRQAGPVVRPAVHVLLVARLQELDLAELALVVQLLDEQELAGVDDRLRHHVLQAGLLRPSSTICWQSSMLVAIGTVHMTCLPALSAASDIAARDRGSAS